MLGKNNSDPNSGGLSYRNGFVIDDLETLEFGTPVDLTIPPTGNPIPSDGKNENTVTLPVPFGTDINGD
jgi:hypothetical protein